jgi:hypothetical protein
MKTAGCGTSGILLYIPWIHKCVMKTAGCGTSHKYTNIQIYNVKYYKHLGSNCGTCDVQGRCEIRTVFWWGKLKVEDVGINEKVQKWVLKKEIG